MPRKKSTIDMPIAAEGSVQLEQALKPLTIAFQSAREKGGTKIPYRAQVRFLSVESLLKHAAEHVKWALQKLANTGAFPTDRLVEITVGESIKIKPTQEEIDKEVDNLSEEERKALEEYIQAKLAALQRKQSIASGEAK